MNRPPSLRRVPSEPKPFAWIPLQGKEAPSTNPPIAHDCFQELNGRMDITVKVASDYLYVGNGAILLRQTDQQAYYAFARRNGELIIPATSIKGPVRAVVEAITNSCVSQVHKKESDRVPRPHKADRCQIKADGELLPALCPACRLFGHTGYRGRVHFSDALPTGPVQTKIIKIPDLWPPRVGRGRKFYRVGTFSPPDSERPEKNHRFVEAVPRGSTFVTTLFFENTTPAELGVLIRALGLGVHQENPSKIEFTFSVKLGGAKPRCLGAVEFRPKKVRLLHAQDGNLFHALSRGGAGQPLVETLLSWLKDESLLDRPAWEHLRAEMDKGQADCPKGMY